MKRISVRKLIISLALAFTSTLFIVCGVMQTRSSIATAKAAEIDPSTNEYMFEIGDISMGYSVLTDSLLPGTHINIGKYYSDMIKISGSFVDYAVFIVKSETILPYKTSLSCQLNNALRTAPISGDFQCIEIPNESDVFDGCRADLSSICSLQDDPNTKYYYFAVILKRVFNGFGERGTVIYEEVVKSSNCMYSDFASSVERQLKSLDTTGESDGNGVVHRRAKAYRAYLGYDCSDGNCPVNLKYRSLIQNNSDELKWVTERFQVDNLSSLNDFYVSGEIIQHQKGGLSHFNVVRREVGYTVDGNSESAFLQDEYTLLEATGYDYVFHKEENYGELTVTYGNFAAKDFALTVRTTDTQHSVLYIRSGDIKTVGGKTTITFDTSNIKTRLSNNFNWNVDNTDFNNYVINNPHDGVVTFTKNFTGSDVSSITVTTSDTNLLADCSLFLQLEVVPPVDLIVTVKYAELAYENGEIIENYKTYQLPNVIASTLYTKINKVAFFEGDSDIGITAQGEFITEKINITDDNGKEIERLTYNGVKCYASDNATKTAMIEVLYTRNTLLRIYDTYLNEYRFIKWTSNSLNYDCGDFLEQHDGYRVKSIESDNSTYAKISTTGKPNDWQNAKVLVLCQLSAGNVIPVTVTYSDKWKVTVEYLEDYYNKSENKKTGFAVKKSLSKEIKVENTDGKAAFADINSPTLEEVATFLGKSADALTVVRFGTPNLKDTTVTCINDEFTIKLSYGRAILKTIQADGSQDFIMIPLSNFADWVRGFGRDWSILVLNTDACIAFDSEFDVDPSELYGYFYVAIFKQQVKNLDSLFAGYTADSCRSFFSCKKVVGNDVYRTCESMGTLSTILCLGINKIIMAGQETAHNDYGTYYSYFLFVDGSSALPYAANNKADDYFDTSSAAKNTFENVGETISTWWKKGGTVVKFIKTLLIVLAVLLVAVIVIKFIDWVLGISDKHKRK